MEQLQSTPSKQSFCRFYLRGLCVYSSKECPFAHGVWDLNYEYWRQGEAVDFDYHKTRDDRQRNIIKGPRIYKTLYQFQSQKLFTLEQLNEEKTARYLVRTLMHQQLYDDFVQLLEIKHPDTPFTEEFLVREFNRIGFNKILMASVKYTQIAHYLCDNFPSSRFFRVIKIIPPNPQKQNLIIKRAQPSQIIENYRQAYLQIMEGEAEIDEGFLKKKIFTMPMPENVPPINIVLKELKIGLRQFIEDHLGLKGCKIIFECTVENIQIEATKFLSEELSKRMIQWNDVFQYVSKALKNNNGNLINQVRPYLVRDGYAFLFFPMVQLIYNPSIHPFFQNLKNIPCRCTYQKPYPTEELLFGVEDTDPLKEGESYDIYSLETLKRCIGYILSSTVLGVDLEGRLRKGGFVEMVQLNNGRNTFLIDIWYMNQLGDFQAFWLAKKVLRNVMVDSNIVKIFHDCRHDSIGLHEMLETCIVNVFDTSATQTFIGQLDVYEKIWKGEHPDPLAACKQAISHCNNVRTPGLNDIYRKYQATHGINQNKEKYHKMWSKGDVSFFCKRPIDSDYRDYCIKDVLDLPEVYQKMLSSFSGKTQNIAYWISNEYAKQGFDAICQESKDK